MAKPPKSPPKRAIAAPRGSSIKSSQTRAVSGETISGKSGVGGAAPAKSSKAPKTTPGSKTAKPAVAKVLQSRPSVKDAKLRFRAYAAAVQQKSRSFEITARKKTVVIFGPLDILPVGLAIREEITVNDVIKGDRTFGSVIHHGPYRVTQAGDEVGIMFAPKAAEASEATLMLRQLERLEIPRTLERLERLDALRVSYDIMEAELRGQHEALRDRLATVLRQANGMIRNRIRLLHETNNRKEAAEIENELRKLESREANTAWSDPLSSTALES